MHIYISVDLLLNMYMYIYRYIYVYIGMCIYIYVCVYTERYSGFSLGFQDPNRLHALGFRVY